MIDPFHGERTCVKNQRRPVPFASLLCDQGHITSLRSIIWRGPASLDCRVCGAPLSRRVEGQYEQQAWDLADN